MIRRLFISLLVCIVLGITAAIVLPRMGMNMPWYVPLLAFAAIFIGVVLNTDLAAEIEDGKRPETPDTEDTRDTQQQSFKIDEYEDRPH